MRRLLSHMILFAFIALAPIIAACDEDSTGPDEVWQSVSMKPTSIANESGVRAFVREGDTWREITDENPDVLNHEAIASSVAIDTNTDLDFRLTSSTRWETTSSPGASFTYNRADSLFTFTAPFGVKYYATGDLTRFTAHMIAGVLVQYMPFGTTVYSNRQGFDPTSTGVEALTTGSRAFPYEEGDVLAFQTFDIVYEAE